MRLHHANYRLGVQQTAQAAAADIGRSPDFPDCLVELRRRNALGVLRLDEFATPCRERVDYALPRLGLYALAPVRTVDDKVGL